MPQTKPAELSTRIFRAQVVIFLVAAAAIVLMVATRSVGWVFGMLFCAVMAYLVFLVVRSTWRLLH